MRGRPAPSDPPATSRHYQGLLKNPGFRNLKIATNLSFKAFYWATQERLNAEAKKETVVQLILWVPRVGELPLPKAPSWGLPPHVWGLPPHKPPPRAWGLPLLSPSGLGAPTP